MRIVLLFVLFLLVIGSSLEAYSKKIIMSTFSNSENANKSLSTFKKTSSYAKLSSLAEKNNFEIYVRQSGKYYIVVAEPILSRDVGIKAYSLVKNEYKNPYLNLYTQAEPKVQKKIEKFPSKEIDKELSTVSKKDIVKSQEISNSPKILEKKSDDIELESKESQRVGNTMSFAMDIFTILKYIAMFLVFLVLVYYYRKFKRIYDEY